MATPLKTRNLVDTPVTLEAIAAALPLVPPMTPKERAAAEARPVKRRQRLKRETREQLLERLRNPQLSLHEAAILLKVCRATVRRYADSGQLPHVRTDGGQRRFYLRDIEMFYRQLKMKK
jgi:excisionase family DNA binding protein